jgi:DHA1 family multidrug resistance protein-like MFS transporter
MYAASALAANSIIRSAAGAAFPLFTNQMFHNLGIQWGATLIGCIALILAPMPFAFYRYGAWVRTKSKFAPCIDLKIKDAVLEAERKEKALSEGKSVETV